MKRLLSVLLIVTLLMSMASMVSAAGTTRVSTPRVSTPKVSTPKASTPKVSAPKTSNSTKSTTTTKPKATTTTKPKTTTTKPKVSITKPTTKKPPVIQSTRPNSSYYHNGSFSSYLMTTAGLYLILSSFEDDGDPVYVYAETGEEVDDDDLESLGVSEVDGIQYANDPAEDNETGDSGFLPFVIILLSMMFIVIFIVALFRIFKR